MQGFAWGEVPLVIYNSSASLTQRRSSICFHSILDAMPPVGRTRMQRLCLLIRLSVVCTTTLHCAISSRVGGCGFLEVSSRMPELPMFLCTSFVLQNISASLTQRRSSICFHSFLDAMPPVGRTRMQRLCVLIWLSTVHSGATLTGHILAPLFRGSAKHLVGVESMMERGRALGQLLVKQVPICLYFCPAMFMCQCEVSAGDAVGDVGCTAHSAPMWVCCLHRDVGPQCRQSPVGD